MTDQNTLDKITSWASDKYTSVAPSLSSAGASAPAPAAPAAASTGLLSAASAPASAPASTSSAPTPDVSSWYRSTMGRDGDAAGISYWENALKTSGATPEQVYSDFQKGAQTNKESVKSGSTWANANTYKGALSSNGSTSVDEWGRNVLGRDLSDAESAQWSKALGSAATPDAARQVYQNFLTANAGQVKNSLDMNAASQLGGLQSPGGATLVDKGQLAVRSINPTNETVNGQMQTIMAADSPLLQQARADGQRTAFDRGMGNSSIAASAGEDSLLRAALQIATPDAAAYGKAADYNTAAQNQLLMWNGDQTNQFAMADKNNNASALNTDKQLAASANEAAAGRAQQMTISQMQDATTRWQQEQSTANSRYNTDLNYKQQVDNQKLGVANNIIANMDLSPDRKAAMLEQLGYGTSAAPGKAGTGLAGAVYVIDSTTSDLRANANVPTGPLGAAIANAGQQQSDAADKNAWGSGLLSASNG